MMFIRIYFSKKAKGSVIMRYLSLLGIVVLLSLNLTNPSYSHTFSDPNKHSVDGGEIRWGTWHGTTKYTDARNNAISKWHEEEVIDIVPDTIWTIEDLSFTDYYENDGYLGYWQQFTGADKIAFNDYFYVDMTACERNKTALHELGHALNFDHNTISGSVMRSGKMCINDLGTHDIEDLNDRWG